MNGHPKVPCDNDCFNCIYPDCMRSTFDSYDRALLREVHEIFEAGLIPRKNASGRYPNWWIRQQKEKALSAMGATERAGT